MSPGHQAKSGGPPAGPYPEIKAWLQRALAIFPMTQHMIGKSRIAIDGDTAQCRQRGTQPMASRRRNRAAELKGFAKQGRIRG